MSLEKVADLRDARLAATEDFIKRSIKTILVKMLSIDVDPRWNLVQKCGEDDHGAS